MNNEFTWASYVQSFEDLRKKYSKIFTQDEMFFFNNYMFKSRLDDSFPEGLFKIKLPEISVVKNTVKVTFSPPPRVTFNFKNTISLDSYKQCPMSTPVENYTGAADPAGPVGSSSGSVDPAGPGRPGGSYTDQGGISAVPSGFSAAPSGFSSGSPWSTFGTYTGQGGAYTGPTGQGGPSAFPGGFAAGSSTCGTFRYYTNPERPSVSLSKESSIVSKEPNGILNSSFNNTTARLDAELMCYKSSNRMTPFREVTYPPPMTKEGKIDIAALLHFKNPRYMNLEGIDIEKVQHIVKYGLNMRSEVELIKYIIEYIYSNHYMFSSLRDKQVIYSIHNIYDFHSFKNEITECANQKGLFLRYDFRYRIISLEHFRPQKRLKTE